MATPVVLTSAGSRPCAVVTRFCTSTAARSTSRPISKVAVMPLPPPLSLLELMYFIPGTPLICCSSGLVTADSTVSALAPL